MSNQTPIAGFSPAHFADGQKSDAELHISSTPNGIAFQIINGDSYTILRSQLLMALEDITRAASMTHDAYATEKGL